MRLRAVLPLSGASALFLLVAIEWLVLPGRREAFGVWASLLLAVSVGTGFGLAWEAALRASLRLPVAVRYVFWLLVGLGAGGALARSLDAFGKLGGRHQHQALLVLGMALVGGLCLAALALGVHPDRHGFMWRRSGWSRLLWALTLCLAAAGLAYADDAVYAALYPPAHNALKLSALCSATFGIALFSPWHERRAPPWLWLPLLAAALVPQWFRPSGASFSAALSRPFSAFTLESVRKLTDFDFDGYSGLFDGRDCRPFDPNVNPGAREVPGNGIDDNCVLGDATVRGQALSPPPVPADPSPLDVLVITADALRPDHLGVYDAAHFGPRGRATTPNLDAFARGAVVFERAYSSGGGTSVALASMLRGVFARKLHWERYFETTSFSLVRADRPLPAGQRVSSMFPLAFDDQRLSLPELLARRGMYTVAVLDDGFSEMLSAGTGIERGFSAFREVDALPFTERDDAGTASLAIKTLGEAPKGRRLFMWVHFFGTHGPNTHHPGAREYGPSLADGYDHEINYLDMQLGRLFKALAAWPRPLAVIFAADHGDVLRNGRYHGYTLDDDVMRIPLLVRAPGWKPARVASPVSLVDVLPTVLAWTQTPAPEGIDGIPLSRVVAHDPSALTRVLFADTWLYSAASTPRVDIAAAVNTTGKLMLDRLSQREVFDLYGKAVSPQGARAPLEHALHAYLEETGGSLGLGG